MLKLRLGKIFKNDNNHAYTVGNFYNQFADSFQKVYGDVIQAFRTIDTDDLLKYQYESIGIQSGMKILDAGCGVCGPAIFFCNSNNTIQIDALTISRVQFERATQNIQSYNLASRLKVRHEDYHKIAELYPTDHFDKVYFLESFGHSTNKKQLLKSVWKVLKPGGELYIKDLFKRKVSHFLAQQKIDHEISRINQAYHYDVADLNEIINIVRDIGFVIVFIKTIDIPIDKFEDLTISNEFQELTGIAKINDWKSYIFPVDFFEVKLYKPEFDIKEGKGRYFLQNIFRLQIENIRKSM